MRTGLAIAASLSSIRPLSLNIVDTVQNEYTKLLGQFPELTRPTTKGETVKHGITHKIQELLINGASRTLATLPQQPKILKTSAILVYGRVHILRS